MSNKVVSAEKDKKNEDKRMTPHDWMQCVVITVLCGISFFIFVGRRVGVVGDSMFPTLHWYDMIVISNLHFTPKSGDIVVFQTGSDTFDGTPLVKRVIAVEGQTIDIDFENGEVFVDGILLDEPYINELTTRRSNFDGPLVVPEGHIFVMGDNRNHSSDSRDSRIGCVDTRYILGKVLFLMIPGNKDDTARDWARFGLVR